MIIKTIPIGYKDRPEDSPSKLNTYSDGVKVVITIFNLIKEYRPLLFFSLTALLLFLIALILGIPVVIEFLQTNLVMKIPSLMVSSMLMILSFLSFTTGLILDIIARKNRQQFEIDLMRF